MVFERLSWYQQGSLKIFIAINLKNPRILSICSALSFEYLHDHVDIVMLYKWQYPQYKHNQNINLKDDF